MVIAKMPTISPVEVQMLNYLTCSGTNANYLTCIGTNANYLTCSGRLELIMVMAVLLTMLVMEKLQLTPSMATTFLWSIWLCEM